MQDELISIIVMSCPICGATHGVELRSHLTFLDFKTKKISYIEKFYVCTRTTDDDNEFELGELLRENLSSARAAYAAASRDE